MSAIDELKLTAFALGELDAAETSAVQAVLADSVEACEHVAAVKALASDLTGALAGEPLPAVLARDRTAALRAGLDAARISGAISLRAIWMVPIAAAAAACLAVVIGLPQAQQGSSSEFRHATRVIPLRNLDSNETARILARLPRNDFGRGVAERTSSVEGFNARQSGISNNLPPVDQGGWALGEPYLIYGRQPVVGDVPLVQGLTFNSQGHRGETQPTDGYFRSGSVVANSGTLRVFANDNVEWNPNHFYANPEAAGKSMFLLSVSGMNSGGPFVAPSAGDHTDDLRSRDGAYSIAHRYQNLSFGFQSPDSRRGEAELPHHGPSHYIVDDFRTFDTAPPAAGYHFDEGDLDPRLRLELRLSTNNWGRTLFANARTPKSPQPESVPPVEFIEGGTGESPYPVFRVDANGTIVFTGNPKQLDQITDTIDLLEEAEHASAERAEIARQVELRRAMLEQQRGEKIDQLLTTAHKLATERRFSEAAETVRQVLALDPSHSTADGLRQMYESLAEHQVRLQQEELLNQITENPFLPVREQPLSTFSTDVDTASYSIVRSHLLAGVRPYPAQVRIEELLNYFSYDYPAPATASDAPVAVHVEIAECPWQPEHRLARIGLKGRVVALEDAPPCNLVFLVDVSGSMQTEDRLPLIRQALRMLVPHLGAADHIAIVAYAGEAGLRLDSTPADQQMTIVTAIDQLQPGGSTNGGAGIQLAYEIAAKNFIQGGINRVILATDGDFNVGVSDRESLVALIAEKARSGVFLSVLGVGSGNFRDENLEGIADRGNGHYAYLDSLDEAYKVLVEQAHSTLLTVAKDVKIQVEFNPAVVSEYRLIGYENRMLAAADFNDDRKDAGEIGSGHTVTALYELVPATPGTFELATPPGEEQDGNPAEGGARRDSRTSDEGDEAPPIDPLKYLTPTSLAAAAGGEYLLEAMTVKVRYKLPESDESQRLEVCVADDGAALAESSRDFQFATAVAGFGMLLRGSQFIEGWTLDAVLELATHAIGPDADGRRAEFVELVRRAATELPSKP